MILRLQKLQSFTPPFFKLQQLTPLTHLSDLTKHHNHPQYAGLFSTLTSLALANSANSQLIMLSGFPCSGKSTRAAELEAYFKSRSKSVVIVNVPVDRNAVFASASAPEKAHRAAEFSAIKRHLNKDTVVIADGLNYIKGFRYQLFCEAKSSATTSCVVHIAAPVEKCREWNRMRRERAEEAASTADLDAEGEAGEAIEQAYDDEVLENLVFRYEEPNPMTRWDSPCFVVPWMDDKAPLEEMYKALFEPKDPVKTNKSTAPVCYTSWEALSDLEVWNVDTL